MAVSTNPFVENCIQKTPVAVLIQAALEWALDPAELDAMFQATSRRQYTRELLFSLITRLFAAVVTRAASSFRRAFMAEERPASLTAAYHKLKGVEPEVCRGLLAVTYRRSAQLLADLGAPVLEDPLPGYRVLVTDGNHFSNVEHRVPEARKVRRAVMPGQAVAVLDLASGLFCDVTVCHNADAYECGVAEPLLDRLGPGDLLVADRRYSTAKFLRAVVARGADFLVRQSARTPRWVPDEGAVEVEVGRCPTGMVSQTRGYIVEVDVESKGKRKGAEVEGTRVAARRIRVRLDTPTRDGDTEVCLLCSVPEEKAGAIALAATYLRRWGIEHAFQDLTGALRGEVETLSYPAAACLGFTMALVAYNALAMVRGALAAEQGVNKVQEEVSSYQMMAEASEVGPGLRVGVGEAWWRELMGQGSAGLAAWMREVAAVTRLERYPLSRRKPKPARSRTRARKNMLGRGIAISKLLDQRKR